jgi:hypothetical protein
MRRVDLSNFNLNLLVALDGLLSQRSVTAAAKRVRVTPSAMSHSLAELRHLLDDPLLTDADRLYRGEWRAMVEAKFGGPPTIEFLNSPVMIDNRQGTVTAP